MTDSLTSRHDFHNFKAIAGLEQACGKFRRGHRFTVVLNHDAPWEEVLADEEGLQRARQGCFNLLPICDDER